MPDPEVNVIDEPRTEETQEHVITETPEAEKPEPAPEPEPETEAQEKKGEGGFSKRIKKLTARNYQLEETIAEMRSKFDAIERRLAGEPAAKPTQSDKPTPDKYQTYEEYVEALADWKSEQRVAKALEDERSAHAKQAEEARTKDTFTAYNKRVAEARGKFDDFDDVVGSSDIEIPQSVQLAIVEMENGPEVAYYLGQHPEEAAKLLELSPLQAVMAIGRISSTLSPSNGSPAKRPVSDAPAPIKPVGGGSTRSSVPLEDLPQREYNRIRNEQDAKRRFR